MAFLFNTLKNYAGVIIAGIIFFTLLIFFEAAQQLYYIEAFDLQPPGKVSFISLFREHLIRWVIWLLISLPLIRFTLINPVNFKSVNTRLLFKYSSFLLITLFVTLLAISLVQLLLDQNAISRVYRYLIFYSFQKTPIFITAYIGLLLIIHFYLNHQQLELKVYELSTLKNDNKKLYQELKSEQFEDNTQVISVKTGHKVKLLPLSEITWIQSGDYCVRLHAKDKKSYIIRNSMNIMEETLVSKGFLRIHRNAIINLSEVKEFRFSEDPQVVLKNGETLKMALSRISHIRNFVKESDVMHNV